ncbi:DUF6789 family protein [Brevundimonas faecalis]|uniref:Uncharacterized BrkB/YihY/UPF0761 family membrane protein n=1 Tax=Brevundimonas faecalis TaxID=947378 RepID=A0ABV2REP5_9CAUL
MMSRVKPGIIAGFVATLVVSILEAANLLFAKVFDPFPEIVARMFGMPGNLLAGWVLHFIVGSLVLGPLFAIAYSRLPTNTPETRGILFAVAAWVAMMLIITIIGDPRTFTGSAGFGTLAWMLITHMIFGGVMGNVYARMLAREKRAAAFVDGAPAH